MRLIYQLACSPGKRPAVTSPDMLVAGVTAAERPSPVAHDAPSSRLIAERAYHDLRDRIVTLRLRPGMVLREDALMAGRLSLTSTKVLPELAS